MTLSFVAAWYVTLIDQLFLAVYIVELLLKLYVWRLRFFKISWNVFGEPCTVEPPVKKML